MRLIIIFLSWFYFSFASGFGEDYYQLDMEQKRQIFFTKMNAMLDKSFEEIEQERAFVKAFLEENFKQGFRLNHQKGLERLAFLREKYRIENLFSWEEYDKKIRPIPKAMGMAQALVESATGTSRFAKEANNLFGEWTWGERGIVPDLRHPNKKHKIKIFDSLQESVDSYVLNLNRHFAYEAFRNKRYEFAKENKNFTSLEAIKTLHSYSALKGKYIDILLSVIKRYELENYDKLEAQSPFIKR